MAFAFRRLSGSSRGSSASWFDIGFTQHDAEEDNDVECTDTSSWQSVASIDCCWSTDDEGIGSLKLSSLPAFEHRPLERNNSPARLPLAGSASDRNQENESISLLWTDEMTMKAMRAQRFQHPNKLFGKRRRRTCTCRSCQNSLANILIERIDQQNIHSLLPQHQMQRLGDRDQLYTMTSFDEKHPYTGSINKGRRWEYFQSELVNHADITMKEKDSLGRDILVCDLEVKGVLLNHEDITSSPKSQCLDVEFGGKISLQIKRRRWMKRFNVGLRPRYYLFKDSRYANRSPRYCLDDSTVFSSMVRPLLLPREVLVDGRNKEGSSVMEEYVAFQAKFQSRKTQQERGTHMRGQMLRAANIIQELSRAASKHSYGMLGTESFTSNQNNMHCWASTEPPSLDYNDWHMEIDLGARHLGGRYVRAIVMQGRLPCVRSFPSSCHFSSSEEFKRYDGPFFAVVLPIVIEQQQWVEHVEVSVRSQNSGGGWISLGTFRANSNAWDQVRIELPAIHDRKIQFLRVRPLSKHEGGFNGNAPAFRLGVIASKQKSQLHASSAVRRILDQAPAHHPAKSVPEGYVRYKITFPLLQKQGVPKVDIDGEAPSQGKSTYMYSEKLQSWRGGRRRSRDHEKDKPNAKKTLQQILLEA